MIFALSFLGIGLKTKIMGKRFYRLLVLKCFQMDFCYCLFHFLVADDTVT